ncbi:MAG: sigma-70 family RNA polymerase sigma factor [Planctomycetaceae bacterium]
MDEDTLQVQSAFVQCVPDLRAFVEAIVTDFSLVDDVIQETFLTVTHKSHEFRSGTNFWAWACAIARIKAVECVRRRRYGPQPLRDEVLEALCAAQPEPEDDETRHRLLARCLAELSPASRRVIELRYSQAQSPAQIAWLLNRPTESVYVSLSRARKALRECISRRLSHSLLG